MEFDLLRTQPLQVSEAMSRDDLERLVLELRANPRWSPVGLPRFDIIDEIDGSFIHHHEHYNKLVGAGASGLRSVRMVIGEHLCDVIIDGSREHDKRPHDYHAHIQFQNYPLIAKLEGVSWPDKARVLLSDNLLVECNCKAFKYFYRYVATNKGFALVPESTPSSIKNPDNRGAVCKHLEHALRYLGSNYSTIASAMKRQAQESVMHPIVTKIDAALNESTAPSTKAASAGVISDIDALIEACRAKGFSKTISALSMARNYAGLEGATGPEAV